MPSPLRHRFRFLRFLGSGAEGAVYLAEDRSQGGDRISLKVLDRPPLRTLPALRMRLSAAARIDHPNIARILDFDVAGDRQCLWIAREYVPGEDLTRFASRSSEELWTLMPGLLESMARALLQFHDRGLVHGDLRPANILCSRSPEGPMLKLIDGGVALQPHDAPSNPLLHLRRQDLKFAGAAFYTALTGKAADRRTAPRRWNPSIPRWIDRLILRLLIPYAPEGLGTAGLFLEEVLRQSRGGIRGRRSAIALSKPPLVGRDRELGSLREKLDRVLSGAEPSGAVLLSGEAGSGKSALLREAQVYVRARGLHFFAARAPAGDGLPYEPLLQIAQSVSAAHGWKDPSLSSGSHSPAELTRTLSRLLVRAAERRPCVVAVDDAQVLGPDTGELLRGIARTLASRPRRVPLLFLIAVRGQEKSRRWNEALRCSSIALGGLEMEDSAALMRIALGLPPDEAMARRLHALSDGNPGLLLTSLELLRSRFRREGSTIGLPSLDSLPVPKDAETAAHRLIAQLDDEELRAARTLSAHPGFLKESICRDVLGDPDGHARLAALASRGVLRRVSLHTYEWSSTALRHALYSKLDRERRQRLHGVFAREGQRWMPPGVLNSHLFQAYHLARGTRPERAHGHALASARLLSQVFRYGEAADYYELALSLLPPDRAGAAAAILKSLQSACRKGGLNRKGRRVSLELLRRRRSLAQYAVAAHFIRIVDGPAAAVTFIEGALHSRCRRSPSGLALLHSKRGFALAMMGRHEEALRAAARAETYLAESRDPAVQADAYLDFGSIRFFQGNLAGACEDYFRALSLTRRSGNPAREAALCDNVSLALRSQLHLEEALRYARRALALKLKRGLLHDSAITRLVLAAIHDDLGDSESAKSELEKAREIFRSRGDAPREALTALARGSLHLFLEEHPEALEWFDRTLEETPAEDRSGLVLAAHSGKAQVYLATGQLSEADACLRRARSSWHPGAQFEHRLAWFRARILVAAAAGRRAEAQQVLRGARHELARAEARQYVYQFRLIGLTLDLSRGDPDETLPRIEELVSSLEGSKLRPLLCDACLLGAEANVRAGRTRQARFLLERARRLLETLPQPSLHIRCDLLRSDLEGSPSERIRAALEAFRRATKHELRYWIQAAALQAARGYEAREDYATALKYYQEARNDAGNKSA